MTLTGQCQRIPVNMTLSPFQLEVLCILLAVKILVNCFMKCCFFAVILLDTLTVELRFQMSAADE